MRIIIFLLMLLLIKMPVMSAEISCPEIGSNENQKENIINKITGISFTSKKIAEAIIENELNEELESKFKADLEIFNVKRLKNGEFKSLKLESKQIKYKSFSMTDVTAKSLCEYNKVYYNKKRVYYPYELPFAFKANITNQDIQNAINSEYFKEELKKNPVKINHKAVMNIETPQIEIKNDKLYCNARIKTLVGSFKLKFYSELTVENNNIVLTNIHFEQISKLFDTNIINQLIKQINPFKYQLKSLNGKYCKIYITKAKISDNIINTEGEFIINKNYTEKNE